MIQSELLNTQSGAFTADMGPSQQSRAARFHYTLLQFINQSRTVRFHHINSSTINQSGTTRFHYKLEFINEHSYERKDHKLLRKEGSQMCRHLRLLQQPADTFECNPILFHCQLKTFNPEEM